MHNTITSDPLHILVEITMKIISSLLIASLLFCVGCYSNQTITSEELNTTVKEELKAEVEQRDITVFTKDSLEYEFSKEHYRIQGDTLSGFGIQTIRGKEVRFQGSIPFADIASVKTTEFSLAQTLVAIGLPVVAVGAFFIAFAIGMSGR
jgi:hypothetical protein